MKHFFKKIVPVLLSLFIVVGVVFSSYDTAKATGMEEYLYVTYWDMMNTLYAMCGYDMKVSDTQINTHGVTGKQAWNNFTSFVENTAKVHWKLYSDAGKAAVKELKDLVNTATEKGISISQDLYDMLKDVFGYQAEYSNAVNQFDTSSEKSVYNMLVRLMGCSDYSSLDYLENVAKTIVNKKSVLSIYVMSGGYRYVIYYDHLNIYLKDGATDLYTAPFVYKDNSGVERTLDIFQTWVSVNEKSVTTYTGGMSDRLGGSWIIKNGCFTGTDTVSAQVSAGACPAEVPDVKPWIKSPDIPDEFRIVKPGEAPGQKPDPDEHPDWLPGIIPFKPKTPQKPDGTEETETTEKPEDPKDPEKPKPDKDKDKDKKRKPAWNPIINPQTGNVIDPETGLDIDPETGKLIDPETGKLIDPDDAGSGGGGGGGIADKLGKYGDITKLFPFCIPFDIVNLIKGMSAEKAPPVFHFKYYFKSINYTFKVDVDLSKYAKYIKLFRYGMQIFYILALMFMTIRISKLFS